MKYIILFFVLFSCSSNDIVSKETSEIVQYSFEITGKSNMVDIELTTEKGVTKIESVVLPWSYSSSWKNEKIVSIKVVDKTYTGDVEVTIKKNGTIANMGKIDDPFGDVAVFCEL